MIASAVPDFRNGVEAGKEGLSFLEEWTGLDPRVLFWTLIGLIVLRMVLRHRKSAPK